MVDYHSEHALVLEESADAGEETDEHDDAADSDEDVRLGVIFSHIVVLNDHVQVQLMVASHPHAERKDPGAC